METPFKAPELPFTGFKWIWASRQPTEGLLRRPVLLGALRAMRSCEGLAKSSQEFYQALSDTERRLRTQTSLGSLRLARAPERNLLRNAGQYWEALGLLAHRQGEIELTELGRAVADGEVPPGRFAAGVVTSHQLPNPNIRTDWSDWEATETTIRPLQLVLRTILHLRAVSAGNGYITVEELTSIMIPLSGTTDVPTIHAEALLRGRRGQLSVDEWPDVTPEANDARMAHEFLLFLEAFDFLLCVDPRARRPELTYELQMSSEQVEELLALPVPPGDVARATADVAEAGLDFFVERERKQASRLARPGQRAFRKEVFDASGRRCLFTGETIPEVLHAAHIVPVKEGGSDQAANGLCLRMDIHRLFDAGHLRLLPDGTLARSSTLERSATYRDLPERVELPTYVSEEAVAWRNEFD